MNRATIVTPWIFIGSILYGLSTLASAQPIDPGVRRAATDGGPPLPLPHLTTDELAFFQDGLTRFMEVDVVSGAGVGQGNGLGPRFNSNQCSSCHGQPFVGGSSPAVNPLVAVARAAGAANAVPWFNTLRGPIREARFVRTNGVADGGVHDLFVITGRGDAGGCNIQQPDFSPAGNPLTGQGGNPNIVFRIPTPALGAGLIEAIPDSEILANMNANSAAKIQVGISGHPNALIGGSVNRSANDGTITRFGWKAQNKSLLMFAGEAYNVEMGISNQLFPQERDETPDCQGFVTPNDTSNFSALTSGAPASAVLSDIEGFANFSRMLAAPVPAAPTPSTINGRMIFGAIGCGLCHTPSMTTGTAMATGSETSPSAALSHQQANLYSDLLVHHMGTGLADGITQGAAGPDEFRTAPLWGVGQREYFLHDGRTSNLIRAIEDHASSGSEANQIVRNFNALTAQQQQDLINFLRSL
ncbi:MAG TPA: di-heme oxidoredictase family protein [Steroidobacteraceae bacterium]|nr:di-heme oxidoredictase family protein [Steroidobacteraceae bacterium]